MALNLSKFLHTKSGRYVMSMILGFRLATLFRATCQGKNCIIKHAPPAEEMNEDAIYKFNDKCYKYTSQTGKCNSNMQTINV